MKKSIGLVFLGALVLAALFGVSTPTAHAASSIPLLPGETTWNGVPSFDFGGNDGVNWDTQYNMDVAPDAAPIQGALKSAGMPIIRTWFFQYSLVDNHAMTDAEQLQKLQAVEGAGAICFANFPTENSVAYDLHLLSILGGHCPYVEVMNEPDIEGVNSTAYLAFWNSFVPQARASYPGILFGGPADYDNQGNECTYYSDGTSACFLQKVMMGMKASGNLPDFVTYHWYPCWNNTADQCLALADSFASAAQQVIGWDTSIFGHEIPVICSEWNADPGSPDFMFDRTWDASFVAEAAKNIATSGLAGAMEFDISQYGNYAADDLFDIYNNGAPFATWTAYAQVISDIRGGVTPPPPPPPAAPTISGFSPTSGPTGTSVTISGSGLTGASSVSFNGAAATFTVDTDTQITATVPDTATTGPITITTPGGSVTSTTSFSVTTPAPPPPAPSPSPSPTPPPPTSTFTDGFEAGNTNAWTSTTLDGLNTMQVESSSVHSGAYALEMAKKANQGDVYIEENVQGTASSQINWAMDLSTSKGHGMLQLVQLLTPNGYFLGSVWLTYNATTGYQELDVYDGNYQWHTCQLPAQLYGQWHTYGLSYVAATDATGSYSLTIDGVVACSGSNIVTARTDPSLGAVQFGSIGSDDSTVMDIKLDDVSIA